MDKIKGLPVIAVIEGSIAEMAGVRAGDKILAFNDVRVENASDYIKAKKVSLKRESMLVERNGKKFYFEWDKK